MAETHQKFSETLSVAAGHILMAFLTGMVFGIFVALLVAHP